MINSYVLDEDNNPLPMEDIEAWAKWFETHDRHVADTQLPNGIRVSTVFLGLDHNLGLIGPPVLWETMIFGGKLDQYQERYSSRKDAEVGHELAIWLVSQSELRDKKSE
jgi:hypothetical protein